MPRAPVRARSRGRCRAAPCHPLPPTFVAFAAEQRRTGVRLGELRQLLDDAQGELGDNNTDSAVDSQGRALDATDALALGVPAKILENRSDVAMIKVSAVEYVNNAKRYRASLRRLD